MRKIGLLLVCMLIVSGCALFEVPEEGLPGLEKEKLVEEVPEDELMEEPEEEPEEEEVFTEEDYAEEKAPPPEMKGDVVFGEITLPDVADIVNENAELKFNIPYTYTGDPAAKEDTINAALDKIRVTLSGSNADLDIKDVIIGTTNVGLKFVFPQGPATVLTRIMYGANVPLSGRKRVQFLPRREETTTAPTTGGPITAGVSDSFIRYGIPTIIKDNNNDRRIIIDLNDQYEQSFTVGLTFSGFSVTPTYQEGDLTVTFEWMMLANADATVTWEEQYAYEYILFYPPYANEGYVVAFSTDTLKEIRNTIFRTEITPVAGVVAPVKLTTESSGRGFMDIGGESFYVDLKAIVGYDDAVISRPYVESSYTSTNEIPFHFFVTGNENGLYFVEYKS